MNRPVITGYGVVSAIGVGKEQTLDALRHHRSGIAPVQYLDTVHRDMLVGEVKLSFDELMSRVGVPSDAEAPQSRTALIGRLALRVDRTEIEASVNADGEIVHYNYDCGTSTLDIARGFGKFAFVDTLSTACSSAANAIGLGADLVRLGVFEQVIVGGSEGLSRLHLNGFNTLMILDQQPCRPFDAHRNGINLGEGAAYLVLESESSALKRGVRPLAVLSGFGNACDAYHQTASSPEGQGAVLAMLKALADARLQASDITYVNCHGTGTPNNDVSELTALHRVFGEKLPPFSSTKGFTGHTTSASGSIEAAFCLLAMEHGFLPVNLNFKDAIDRDYPVVEDRVLEKSDKPRHLLCNAFAFGGNDSSLILSDYSESSEYSDYSDYSENSDSSESLVSSKPLEPVRPIYLIAKTELDPDSDPNFRDYLAPLESRRMDKLLKRTVACSLQTLRQIPGIIPDAIITATVWGSAISAIAFFHDMMRQGLTNGSKEFDKAIKEAMSADNVRALPIQ